MFISDQPFGLQALFLLRKLSHSYKVSYSERDTKVTLIFFNEHILSIFCGSRRFNCSEKHYCRFIDAFDSIEVFSS